MKPRIGVNFGGAAGSPPAAAVAWRDRGIALLAKGDRRGAADAFLRYMSMPPGDPALRRAAADLAGGRLQPAGQTLRAFLAGHPHDPLALWMLGQIGLRLDNDNNALAETLFRQVVTLVPGFPPARFDLVRALFGQGKSEEALAELAPLLRAAPDHGPYRELQVAALSKTGRFAEALGVCEAQLATDPANAGVLVRYGIVLKTLRRGDEAIAAFRVAISSQPAFGEPWWHIANMKTGALTTDDIATLQALVAAPGADPTDLYHQRFALARAIEDTGDHGAAFTEYGAANRARLAAMPKERIPPSRADQARRMAAVFTPAFVAAREGAGMPGAAPIFILGMPRSGSTLLEQMLSCHPAIEGTQELPDLPIVVRALSRGAGATREHGYPEILDRTTPGQLRTGGADYLARVAKVRKTDRAHFLDKQPVNWLHAGLIALMLPDARIIDMRRDPLECCLSMYRQHFARGALFTYSIEQLAEEYRAYEALMAHFAAVLPGRIRQVRLADLVDNPEGTIRAVSAYLGLPFAAECLDFHLSDRPVFTPSSEQVRRPINRASGDLLRGYAPHIGALREALGDPALAGRR